MRESGSVQRAENILKQLESLHESSLVWTKNDRPNTICYVSVIDAWSRSGEEGAGEMAESVLSLMERMQHDTDHGMQKEKKHDVKLTTYAFNVTINAWAKSRVEDDCIKTGDKAELLLKKYKGYTN